MRDIDDQRVLDAFAATDRREFLPAQQLRFADDDRPLRIGFGQTNSQPTTVANMLELLEVREGQRVLDVGAGSGWTTALLGRLVGPAGRVIGVELVPELARWGAANLARQDLPWATITASEPGVYGVPAAAPFDRILVSAEAPDLPDELVAQLAPGGRMVLPVRHRMLVVDRRHDGTTHIERHGRYAFVPLLRQPR
jgi:protein-L-isoaspartate(D-aspartate) O-methyltransferase